MQKNSPQVWRAWPLPTRLLFGRRRTTDDTQTAAPPGLAATRRVLRPLNSAPPLPPLHLRCGAGATDPLGGRPSVRPPAPRRRRRHPLRRALQLQQQRRVLDLHERVHVREARLHERQAGLRGVAGGRDTRILSKSQWRRFSRLRRRFAARARAPPPRLSHTNIHRTLSHTHIYTQTHALTEL